MCILCRPIDYCAIVLLCIYIYICFVFQRMFKKLSRLNILLDFTIILYCRARPVLHWCFCTVRTHTNKMPLNVDEFGGSVEGRLDDGHYRASIPVYRTNFVLTKERKKSFHKKLFSAHSFRDTQTNCRLYRNIFYVMSTIEMSFIHRVALFKEKRNFRSKTKIKRFDMDQFLPSPPSRQI